MINIDEYLMYLQEASRWKKEFQKDKLSDTSVRKIQKAGLVKPARQWVAGVEKGTQNKLKKMGAKVQHKPDVAASRQPGFQAHGVKAGETMRNPLGAHAKVQPGGGRGRIHVATGLKKKQQGLGTIIKRHEADEVSSMKKFQKKHGQVAPQGANLSVSGGHASDEVLRKEKELTKYGKKMYGKKLGLKPLEKARKDSGEDEHISSQTKRSIKKREGEIMKQSTAANKEQIKSIKGMSDEQKKDLHKNVKTLKPAFKGEKNRYKLMKRSIEKYAPVKKESLFLLDVE